MAKSKKSSPEPEAKPAARKKAPAAAKAPEAAKAPAAVKAAGKVKAPAAAKAPSAAQAPAEKPPAAVKAKKPTKPSKDAVPVAPPAESSAPEKPARRARAAKAAASAPATPAVRAPRSEDEGAEPERHPSVRLHKFLAHGGTGSRREAETFIEQGRVSVNGKPVTQLGFKVDPAVDRVLLDGEPIQAEERVYFLLHKPAGFVCTNHDERGRPRAVDLLRGVKQRIYTVGRLDVDSLGLILVTNDGDLSNIVCHPRYRIQKRYQVAVKGFVTREQVTKLEAGVWLAEGKSSPAKVVPLGRNPRRNETILEMTIFEGRNREIRRVFAGVGLLVRRLLRISIGPLELPQLQPGEAKQVSRADLAFVDDAKRMYEANREAWDAELPPPKQKVWRPSAARQGGRPRGAGGPRREGGFGGPRREGGFGGPRREGGFGGPRREGGGFGGPRRESGGYGAPSRGGDYGPARRDDYGPARRDDEGPARRDGGSGGGGGGGYGQRPPFRRPFDGPPSGGARRPRPNY